MRKVFSTSENLGTLRSDGQGWEVMAEARSDYNESAGMLSISLDAYLRPASGPAREPWRPSWLPATRLQKEHVALDEAIPVVKDVFRTWVQRIRQSAPDDFHSNQGSGL